MNPPTPVDVPRTFLRFMPSANGFRRFAINPWVVAASLIIGIFLGLFAPNFSLKIGIIGGIYVDVLKMIVLPFMLSAIIFSMQRLFQEGGNKNLIPRVLAVFVLVALGMGFLGVLSTLLVRPGVDLPPAAAIALGEMVSRDHAQDSSIALFAVESEAPGPALMDVLRELVPTNIFAVLASGDMVRALIFSLLFGFAIGQVPSRISLGIRQSLETVYESCQTLTRWLNYPLPLVLVCMTAEQMAKTGGEPLMVMGRFVSTLLFCSLIVFVLAVALLWKRSGCGLLEVLDALRTPATLALATRNGATCMPAMISSLIDDLGYSKSRVELLVPLAMSLVRIGPILYYACATIFVAQLYGRDLGFLDFGAVIIASVVAGLASSGMSGVASVSLISIACGYLGLPYDAAFVLFLAVEPVCEMLRGLLLVIGNMAVVALICPQPLDL